MIISKVVITRSTYITNTILSSDTGAFTQKIILDHCNSSSLIDKQMSARGVHRIKSTEHASGDLIHASKCDIVSGLYHTPHLCGACSSVTVHILCTGNSHKSSIYFTTSVDRSMVKDGIPHVCTYVPLHYT